jgi:tetratricopeptide (TPR) repeat protein/curli biogenesis system outer membrane secretion channel CsgG
MAAAICLSGVAKDAALAGDASDVPDKAEEKIVVGVMPFGTEEEETKDDEPAEVTEAREQIAREALVQSLARSFSVAALKAAVIDDAVRELAVVSPKDAAERDVIEIGRRAGAQYMVLGRVTKISQRNDVREKSQIFSKSRETSVTASAQLQAKVIEVSSGRVVMNLPSYGVGRSTHTTKSTAGFIGLGTLIGPVGDLMDGASELSALLKSSLLQDEEAKLEAIGDAGADLANKIKGEVAGEYLYVRDVRSAKDGGIEINADSTKGINEEDLYLVYADGAEKRDANGALTERESIPIAVVKIDMIHRGYSDAKIVPAGGDAKLIRKGDKVSPISKTGARELSVGKKFVKDRPKQKKTSEDYAALLGGEESTGISSSGGYNAVLGGDGEPSAPMETNVADFPIAQAAPAALEWSDVPGVDRNSETGAKLIETYPLSAADKNNLGIAHRGAQNLYGQGKYKEAFEAYKRLASDYKCDYLSAYWAGMSAAQMEMFKDAGVWFKKALEVNPDYKPAVDGAAGVGGKI